MKNKLLLATSLVASVALGSQVGFAAGPAYDIWDFSGPATGWFAAPGTKFAGREPAQPVATAPIAPAPTAVVAPAPAAITIPAPAEPATPVVAIARAVPPAGDERLQVTIGSPPKNELPWIFAIFQGAQRDSSGFESFYDPITRVWINYDPARATTEYGQSQRANPVPREEIDFQTEEPAGSIIISTTERRLYYILGNGRALRYGVGVGRDGFTWTGVKSVTRKAEWPDWRPPAEMIARRPDLPRFMPGGIANPLGARALYLGSTIYRIHGSNEPNTIGQAVSSGCFRMTNDDVADLYERAKVGGKVVVR